MKRVVLKIKDRDNTIVNILNYIKELTTAGHGFDVEIDPDDKEYHKHFYIDGDGEDKLLTIETYEPKTGHWIYENVLYSRCSECGEHAIIANWSKVLSDFCPKCGAKMIEPQESEEIDADSN